MKNAIIVLCMIFALVAVYQPMYAQTEPVKVISDNVSMKDDNVYSTSTVTASSYESSRSQALLRALSSAMAYTDTAFVRSAKEYKSASCLEDYTIKVQVYTDKKDEGYESHVDCIAQRKSYHESVKIKK